MTLPAFVVERVRSWYATPAPAAVDRYPLSAGRLAANPPITAAAVDRWDRQTDGRWNERTLRGQCQ